MTYKNFKIQLMKEMKKADPTHEFKYINDFFHNPDNEYLVCTQMESNQFPALDITGIFKAMEETGENLIPYAIQNFKDIISQHIESTFPTDFNIAKDKIFLRLLDPTQNKNQILLGEAAHMSYLDLEVVFYLSSSSAQSNYMLNAYLTPEIIKSWEINYEDLLQYALQNTANKCKPEFHAFVDLILINNKTNISFLMLNLDFWEDLTNILGMDLYIVPLSETTLLVRYGNITAAELTKTLQDFPNRNEESFSGQIYIYRSGSKQLSIWINAFSFNE